MPQVNADRAQSAAVLGTGIMGAAMARNIARAGIATAAWNRTHSAAAPLAEDGIEVFESAADAVRGRDVVLTIVSDADAVLAVMQDGVFDAMQPHAVWVQSATIGLAGANRAVAAAADRGVRLIDAPVSGTKTPAVNGTLVFLASGDESARDFAMPVLEACSSKVVWLGEAGMGSRMKLVTNDWVLGQTALLSETLALCESLGIDPAKFSEAIDGAPVASPYALIKAAMMQDDEYPPNFPLEWGEKDTRLIEDAAADNGLDLPIARATAEHFGRALREGAGKEDVAAIHRWIKPA